MRHTISRQAGQLPFLKREGCVICIHKWLADSFEVFRQVIRKEYKMNSKAQVQNLVGPKIPPLSDFYKVTVRKQPNGLRSKYAEADNPVYESTFTEFDEILSVFISSPNLFVMRCESVTVVELHWWVVNT